MTRLVIIGGGITGLAAAERLVELAPGAKITLLEAGTRLGGVLETIERDGFLIERGADNFITTIPAAVDLCRKLGLEGQLSGTNQKFRRAFVVRRGKLVPIPTGFALMVPERLGPVLRSPLLTPWGKLRLLAEYFVPRRAAGGDESLASFARRRLGREVYERLVQPLVGGIYTADPERLSLRATLPRFLETEERYGGLLRGRGRASKSEPDRLGSLAVASNGTGELGAGAAATSEGPGSSTSGARYGLFLAPTRGFSALVAALALRLAACDVRLGTRAAAITRTSQGGWSVAVARADGAAETLDADAVIMALPAPAAARLLGGVDAELSAALGEIEYAGAAVVSLGFRRDEMAHPLDGFGLVVPAIEQRSILAASFSSVKYPGRAPDGTVLVRTFVGGACQPELADLADDELLSLVERELGELIGARGRPLVADIARWPASMPQYHVGHLDRVRRIEQLAARLPGLALAGNAYRGVGVSQCVLGGQQAAERVAANLAPRGAQTH